MLFECIVNINLSNITVYEFMKDTFLFKFKSTTINIFLYQLNFKPESRFNFLNYNF